MNKYKNYNIFALRGDTEMSDADVCETLGLDPRLAGTPEINEAAIKKMHKENYDSYISNGMSSDSALERADGLANNARDSLRQLLNNQ